jgi:phosphate transport system permease protein
MRKRLTLPHIEELVVTALMVVSALLIAGVLGAILLTVVRRGLPALSVEMLTQTPKGGYYLGKGGGILNAIVGSLYLAGGGTLIGLLLSLPVVLGLNVYARGTRWAEIVRLSLDVMWGIPSIVYGAFGLTVMLAFGLRASLLAGILVLGLLEMPILIRALDELIRLMPAELEEAAFAVGATRLEAALTVILRQVLPGLATAALLAFGRGIGDAASVLFTAGYTDRIPQSLTDPAASLPLAVFFQLSTPYAAVQQRGYAAALVLTIIVLAISLGWRALARWLGRYSVK